MLAAFKQSPFAVIFVRNAGKIAFVSGIIGSVLLALNRSWLHGTPVADNMSLSGVALILCSLAILPADRWPVWKRIAGVLGLAYAVLLVLDVWGKSASAGVIAGMALSVANSLSLVLERKHGHIHKSAKNPLVAAFRKAPVFWTAMACLALKPFYLMYGWANGEPLFVPLVIFLSVENLSIALTDNRVRRAFGMDAPAHGEALIA
jgi:hypothetical protein